MRTIPTKKAEDATKNKGGRPPKQIDLNQVKQLAALQCTDSEIRSVLGVSKDTFIRRKADPEFAQAIADGKEMGKVSLRRMQWNLAKNSTAMLIFMGKNYLNQRDKPEDEGGDKEPLPWKE